MLNIGEYIIPCLQIRLTGRNVFSLLRQLHADRMYKLQCNWPDLYLCVAVVK